MIYFWKKGIYKRQNEFFCHFFGKKSFGNILGTFFKRVDYTKIDIKVKRWRYTFSSGKSLNPAPQTKKKNIYTFNRHSSPHLDNHMIIIPETKTLTLMNCFSRLKVNIHPKHKRGICYICQQKKFSLNNPDSFGKKTLQNYFRYSRFNNFLTINQLSILKYLNSKKNVLQRFSP